MSSEPLALGHELPPKRSRAAYPQEVAILDEKRHLNKKFIKALQEELDMRTVRANTAAEEVLQKAAKCAEAELHLNAINTRRDTLIEAKNELSSSDLVTDRLRALIPDNQKPRYPGNTYSPVTHAEFEELITLGINKINGSLRLAHEEAGRALEEQEEAIAHEERCRLVVRKIQKYISEMKEIIEPPLNHSIWRVPEEIWCQIFSEVTCSNIELEEVEIIDPLAPIVFPSLTLSAVCHDWRTITHDHTLLWRTIHFTIDTFSTSDALRIRHYLELSKNQPLRILVEVPVAASASPRELDLITQSLCVLNQVELLVVRRGAAGRSVILALSKCLSPPMAITVAFDTGGPVFRASDPEYSFSINLERLKMTRCSPLLFGALNVQPHSRKIQTLEVRNSLRDQIPWSMFRTRIVSVANTLQDLVYVGGFSSAEFDCGVGPTVLKQLTSLTAELEVILLFYRSKIYTPALQSLTIVALRAFNQHAEWQTYANDSRGGGNITTVAYEKNGPTDETSHVMPIQQLPKLKKVSLRSPHVGQILQGLNRCAQNHPERSERSGRRTLGALRVLSITDYDGDARLLATFVRNHQQHLRSDVDLEFDSTSAESNTALQVELQNCPNISAEVLAELLEMGSMPG